MASNHLFLVHDLNGGPCLIWGNGSLKSLSNRFLERILERGIFGKLFIPPRLDMSHRMVSFTTWESIPESFLARCTRACAAGCGSGLSQSRDCAIVWHLEGLHQAISAHNDERKGMCGPKRFLGGPRRNGQCFRLACCPNYKRMMTLPWNNTVPCGSTPVVNA
jgi:hypothetical protein